MAIKALSWRWKLAIALLVFAFLFAGLAFSISVNDYFKAKIDAAFDKMPASERRQSPLADRYMQLAWWRANVLGDAPTAIKWYKDFCGINEDSDHKPFFRTWKLNGKCSEDGLEGWGPMHPRGPEAYFSYLEQLERTRSSQILRHACYDYYTLFYLWMKTKSPDHKPHPLFNKYWPKIRNKLSSMAGPPPPPGMDLNATEALPYTEP